MASKTLMLLSMCTVVSPTDAVDDQSLLLPPPPPAHGVHGCGWEYLQGGQGGHTEAVGGHTEAVWRVEGNPTRARNGTAELDRHLFTKQDYWSQIDACQQVGGLPTKAESGVQPRPVPAQAPPKARPMEGLPAQRPGDAKEAPPI
jgi:hypothetical protein